MDIRQKKKLPRMEEGETGEDGTVWVWIAYAPEHRLILSMIVGPRRQESANELVGRMANVLIGRLPLFESDGLDQYGVALLDQWHVEVAYPRTGKRGRPRNTTKQPHTELRYVQVVKKREGRKLVEITRRVVHGDPKTVKNEDICTSLIERLNHTTGQKRIFHLNM